MGVDTSLSRISSRLHIRRISHYILVQSPIHQAATMIALRMLRSAYNPQIRSNGTTCLQTTFIDSSSKLVDTAGLQAVLEVRFSAIVEVHENEG